MDERVSIVDLLKAGYSEGILYRLYLPELLLDIPKIIYLDVDILAHGDIRDLWNVDVGEYAVAGRWDPPLLGFKKVEERLRKKCQPLWESMDWQKYINFGVLVLNLEKIRQEHHLLEEAISFWDRYGMMMPDQDAINYIFRGDIFFLSAKYNMPNKDYPVQKEGIFYHYTYMAGERNVLDPSDQLYLSYWEKTPFFSSDYGKKEKSGFLRRLKNPIEVYERLREFQPLDREEALILGRCYYVNGEFQKAYEYLSDEAIEKLTVPCYGSFTNTQTEQAHIWELDRTYIMAKSLKALQRRSEAVLLLQATLKYECDCAYLEHNAREMRKWNYLGELLYEEGRYEEAMDSFLKCLYFGTIEKNSCAAYALLHLVKCSLRMEKIAEAKRYYTMLHVILPLDDRVRICGIQIELAEKGKQKGRRYYQRILLGTLRRT